MHAISTTIGSPSGPSAVFPKWTKPAASVPPVPELGDATFCLVPVSQDQLFVHFICECR